MTRTRTSFTYRASSRLLCLGFAALALLGLSLGLSAARPASAQQNLVTNPGFETGTFSGYTVTPAASGSNLFVGTALPHTGTYYANFAGTTRGSYDTISQSLGTSIGQSYLITFYLYSNNGRTTSDNGFIASFGGATLLSLTNAPDQPYTLYSFTRTATTTATTLSFSGYNEPNAFRLDDISVTANGPAPAAGVPEPSQTAAMGMGLLGLACLTLTAKKRKAFAAVEN